MRKLGYKDDMNWLKELLQSIANLIPRIWLVNPDESGVRITLGKHYKPTPPGWYVYWPIIQDPIKLTVTPQIKDIRSQSVLTPYNESFCVGGAVKYRIKDAVAAILKVQDFDQTLQALCLGIISRYFADKVNDDYSDLEDYVVKGVKGAARGWGLDVMAVYITDLGPTRNIRLLSDTTSITIIPEIEE